MIKPVLHHFVGVTAESGGGEGGRKEATLQSVDKVVGSVKHLDEGAAVAALGHLLSVPQHITCSPRHATLSRAYHRRMAMGP